MAKINILIVEDEPLHAEKLNLALTELGYNVVAVAEEGKKALAEFYTHEPDLVIIDIKLIGEMDGIKLAERIASDELNSKPVIFLTSDKSHETFEKAKITHPCAYLIKPFDKYSLQCSVELALHQFYQSAQGSAKPSLEEGMLNNEIFYIKKQKKIVKVPVEDIMYIEVESNYSTLITKEGRFVLKTSLNDLYNKLPQKEFIRIHRNYIVNMREIKDFDFEEYTVQIQNRSLPIGKSYKNKIKEKLLLLS